MGLAVVSFNDVGIREAGLRATLSRRMGTAGGGVWSGATVGAPAEGGIRSLWISNTRGDFLREEEDHCTTVSSDLEEW